MMLHGVFLYLWYSYIYDVCDIYDVYDIDDICDIHDIDVVLQDELTQSEA